jgi:hypothetical protein
MNTCECQWDAHFGSRLREPDWHPYKAKRTDLALSEGVQKCRECREHHSADSIDRVIRRLGEFRRQLGGPRHA